MKTIIEHIFNGNYSNTYTGTTTYIGDQIIQHTGTTSIDNYITVPISIARPMEAPIPNAVAYPFVITWSDTIDWVFLVGNGTAAVTRVVVMYEYNKLQKLYNYKGFISLSSSAGNATVRGFRMDYTSYTKGTVEVNGTSVIGTGTEWVDDRMAAGARIGFGSNDPTQITTWYEMSDPTTTNIPSNTGLTLSSSAGVLSPGTLYVMEELRVVMTTTNATLTNGGLFLIKGLNPSVFTSGGLTFTLSANVDNLRAEYWLADAATVTMTASWGCAVDVKSGYTSHDCYVLNGAVSANNYFIYKYNIRELLSPTTGKATDSYLYKTGAIASALTGTIIQTNNGRIMTLNHGVASGVKCLYFVTTTRIYRCIISNITNDSTNYVADAMVEIPPGGTSTYVASTFTGVEHSSTLDKLVISGGAGGRCYITSYQTTSDQFDIIFLSNDLQYDQSSADSGSYIHPSTNSTAMSVYTESGYLYICRNGTNAALNQIYVIPVKPHRNWCDDHYSFVTTPVLSINAIRLYRLYVSSNRQTGDSTFGVPPEDFDICYRTTDFENSGGTWTLIDYNGDLSGIGATDSIQFKIKFKVFGTWCVPAKIYSLSLVYEDSNTDSHYIPSVNKSSIVNRIFAYRQIILWSSAIPNLRIRLYNAATSGLVLDDTVLSSSFGIWQYSTDGTNWNTWNSSADLVGNYIRYTATTLPAGIIVRVLLTQ